MNLHSYLGPVKKQKFEKELSKHLDKDVLLKTKTILAEDNILITAKIYIEGEYSGVDVDYEDLTEYDRCGKLSYELAKIARKIKETT